MLPVDEVKRRFARMTGSIAFGPEQFQTAEDHRVRRASRDPRSELAFERRLV